MSNDSKKIILGIDPGTVVMGFSVIDVSRTKIVLLEMDVLKMASSQHQFERLHQIYQTINNLATKFRPSEMAIEAPFFGKNVQSMLKLGRSQGVAIATAMKENVEVFEYSPRKIKQSITGNGNATKEQVWKMLKIILQLDDEPKYFDASDALAVAVCHHFQSKNFDVKQTDEKKKNLVSKKSITSWKQFLANNPERINVKM